MSKNASHKPNNVINPSRKNVPINLLGHLQPQRKYIPCDLVTKYAEDTFDRYHAPITVEDVRLKFNISTAHARRILKRLRTKTGIEKGLLFTPQNLKPQEYYPESMHAVVIERFRKRNVPLDTTGTATDFDKNYASRKRLDISLHSITEKRKADSLLEALLLTRTSPRRMHNFHLQYPIDRQYYHDIDAHIQHHTKAKKIEHRIDGNLVSYLYYRNGIVTATIACTKTPFRIETVEDEYAIHSYLGQIRAKSLDHLSDSRGVIVPPLNKWLLRECDVNIDIEITDTMQLSFPTIQIYPNVYVMQIHQKLSCKSFFNVLRIYVKSIEDKAFLRFEGLMTPCSPVLQVLQNLRYPRAISENESTQKS